LADFIFSTILEAFLDSFLEDEIKGKKYKAIFTSSSKNWTQQI
jgi:hypothetical protein